MIQPQTVGGWHLALVYLLVWVGAFLGTYLGGAYMAEASTYFESYGLDRPRTLYWKVRGAGRRCAGRGLRRQFGAGARARPQAIILLHRFGSALTQEGPSAAVHSLDHSMNVPRLPLPRPLFVLQVGMVWFFAQAVMMIGVPYALAVLPVQLWRCDLWWQLLLKLTLCQQDC